MNCLVCRCLNLGGPFLGVTGPPVTLVADRISALGGSKSMASLAGTLWRPLASDPLTLQAGGGADRVLVSPPAPNPWQILSRQRKPRTPRPSGC